MIANNRSRIVEQTIRLTAILACAVLVPLAPSPGAAAPVPARPSSARLELPMRFEPNLGRTDAAVDYVARGAGYTAFDGEAPAETEHFAIAGAYAHATAPLRRLQDRYV